MDGWGTRPFRWLSVLVLQMNANSHVVMCGSISTYNKTTQYPPPISEELQAVIQKKNITRLGLLSANRKQTDIRQMFFIFGHPEGKTCEMTCVIFLFFFRDRFLVLNYADQFEGGVAQLMEWYFQGKIKVSSTIIILCIIFKLLRNRDTFVQNLEQKSRCFSGSRDHKARLGERWRSVCFNDDRRKHRQTTCESRRSVKFQSLRVKHTQDK